MVDGRIVYRPILGYAGGDSFQYTVGDGHGGSATATVTLTIGATRTLSRVPVILR